MADQHCTQRWALQFSFLQRRDPLDYPEGDQTRSERPRVADLSEQELNLAPCPSGPLCTTPLSASAPSLTASLDSWKYPHPWFLLLVAPSTAAGDRVTGSQSSAACSCSKRRTSWDALSVLFSHQELSTSTFLADASFAPLTHRLPGPEIKVSCTEFTPALTIAKEDHLPTSVKP